MQGNDLQTVIEDALKLFLDDNPVRKLDSTGLSQAIGSPNNVIDSESSTAAGIAQLPRVQLTRADDRKRQLIMLASWAPQETRAK